MKPVEIELKRITFEPGEVIHGEVVIRTKNTIGCEIAILYINGHEKTEIVRRDGDTSKVYNEDIWHIKDEMTLMEGGTIHPNETRLPFKFTLKEGIPPSYSGVSGNISYGLRVEVTLDSKQYIDEREFRVTRPLNHIAPHPVMRFIKCEGARQIQIETPRNTFTPGESFPVRLFIRGDPDIRGIRLEILHEEICTAKTRSNTVLRQLATAYLAKEELELERWLNLKFQTNVHWPRTFSSNLIRSEVILKVTADIPFRFDKSVVIQLIESASQSELFEHDELSA